MGFWNNKPFDQSASPQQKANEFDAQIKENEKSAHKKDREAEQQAKDGGFIPRTPRGRAGNGKHRKNDQ